MPALKSDLSELRSLLSGTVSPAIIDDAKRIVERLQHESQKTPIGTSALNTTTNAYDSQYLSVLEKLHETQEELLNYTMQNAMLLDSLNECYEAMEKSVLLTDRLIARYQP